MVKEKTIVFNFKYNLSFLRLAAFYRNINNRLSFICGGSLISKLHIVTAAHCIQDKRSYERLLPEKSMFFFGKHNLNDNNEIGHQQANARRFIVHEDWKINDNAYDADIAIIVLDNQIQFTDYVRPICLWAQADELNLVVGQVGVVVGMYLFIRIHCKVFISYNY